MRDPHINTEAEASTPTAAATRWPNVWRLGQMAATVFGRSKVLRMGRDQESVSSSASSMKSVLAKVSLDVDSK